MADWAPTDAEVDAGEKILADCMCEPRDGYWRQPVRDIAIAMHEARVREASVRADAARPMPAALVVDATTHRETDDELRCSIPWVWGTLFRVASPEELSAMIDDRQPPQDRLSRAFALAVDSLHLIAAEQAEGGDSFEAEGTLWQINETMGGPPDTLYRLPSRRPKETT
jgi:hypothetical protein